MNTCLHPCPSTPAATPAHQRLPAPLPIQHLQVKVQTVKTSVEAATLLLRIDDIVSGMVCLL